MIVARTLIAPPTIETFRRPCVGVDRMSSSSYWTSVAIYSFGRTEMFVGIVSNVLVYSFLWCELYKGTQATDNDAWSKWGKVDWWSDLLVIDCFFGSSWQRNKWPCRWVKIDSNKSLLGFKVLRITWVWHVIKSAIHILRRPCPKEPIRNP